MSNLEQTLSIIKPDAVERNLQDQIKNEFKNTGFEILKEKKFTFQKKKLKNFIKSMSQTFYRIYAPTYPLTNSSNGLQKKMQYQKIEN